MSKYWRLLALFLVAALLAAACGSDDDDGETSTEATEEATEEAAEEATEEPAEEATEEAAEEATEEPAEEATEEATEEPMEDDGLAAAAAAVEELNAIPDEIGVTIPLDGVPEPKTVGWLQCELESCELIGTGFEIATEMLGWELEVFNFSSFVDPNVAMQQAVDAGVDYIALTGQPLVLYADQAAAAAEAGIPILSCFDSELPDPEVNNIYMQCGDAENVYAAGTNMANWIINDSQGTANTLVVNIRDFAVLLAEEEGGADTFAANCPDGCSMDVLPVSIEQFAGGEVPQAVASALQADPSIDYVWFTFADIPIGVADTLEAADLLDGVNLVGVDFNATLLQEIVDGRHQSWTANPKEYSGALMVDHAARLALGMELEEERQATFLPTFVVDTAEEAEPWIPTLGWPGPETMYEQFAELWGVDAP